MGVFLWARYPCKRLPSRCFTHAHAIPRAPVRLHYPFVHSVQIAVDLYQGPSQHSLGGVHAWRPCRKKYRGTSLIRNCTLPQYHPRPLGTGLHVLWGPTGGGVLMGEVPLFRSLAAGAPRSQETAPPWDPTVCIHVCLGPCGAVKGGGCFL